jgi:hypothetical protein
VVIIIAWQTITANSLVLEGIKSVYKPLGPRLRLHSEIEGSLLGNITVSAIAVTLTHVTSQHPVQIELARPSLHPERSYQIGLG